MKWMCSDLRYSVLILMLLASLAGCGRPEATQLSSLPAVTARSSTLPTATADAARTPTPAPSARTEQAVSGHGIMYFIESGT